MMVVFYITIKKKYCLELNWIGTQSDFKWHSNFSLSVFLFFPYGSKIWVLILLRTLEKVLYLYLHHKSVKFLCREKYFLVENTSSIMQGKVVRAYHDMKTNWKDFNVYKHSFVWCKINFHGTMSFSQRRFSRMQFSYQHLPKFIFPKKDKIRVNKFQRKYWLSCPNLTI